MRIGYARVSTDGQDHALQLDALRAAGCEKVFVETASGSRTDRPELAKALEMLRPDDLLIVFRLDRLARSLRHLIDIAESLNRRGIGLVSATESIDTTTSGGRFMFSILGALAQMELEIIRERTRAGLAAAAARGRRGGRPPVLDATKVRAAKAMLADLPP
jgi:DNA invertase Pin-like site-specific DNA recombinase